MSTRSYICMETEATKDTGKVLGIYCHSDGYLTYNGAILIDHYNERDKVEALMNLGNLSSLGEKLNPNPEYPHTFDYRERQIGVCVAYGRDRSEPGQEAKEISLKTIANDPWIMFTYVYTLDGKWKYFENTDYTKIENMREVKEDIDAMFEEFAFPRPKNLYGFYDDEAVRILKKEYEDNKKQTQEA